mgnify:CR=1 FL=1
MKYFDVQVYNSLTKLLEFDGDVENTFGLTFQVHHEFLDCIFTHDLLVSF